MKKSAYLPAVALAGAAAVLLAGCSGGGGGTPSESGGGDAEAGRACVILPDAASSPRWENFDRKYLQEGLEAAGFEVDIQNAQGDVDKYVDDRRPAADPGLRRHAARRLPGCRRGRRRQGARPRASRSSPTTVRSRAPTTTCRSTTSRSAALEGQTVLDGLEAAGKDPATAIVVYMGGDPTDGNAKHVP